MKVSEQKRGGWLHNQGELPPVDYPDWDMRRLLVRPYEYPGETPREGIQGE